MRHKCTLVLFYLCAAWIAAAISSDSSSEEEVGSGYKRYVGEQQYRLPFKTRISEPFKEGQTIHAVGKIDKDPKRVEFNFHKGANENDDMPLHISIRFDEGIFYGVIVYNTFRGGQWGTEEQRITSPYAANEEFDIRVRIVGGKYQVFGNRREIGTFEQRQPLEGVNHVSIVGGLSNLTVFHYGGTVFPNPYYAIARLTVGKRLDISALPTGNRVNINLQRRGGEYALHLSIRYNEGVIVRNAMSNRNWGEEDRSGGLPLGKSEIFDLTIINERRAFVILLDGRKFAEFGHRGSADDVETLEVDGNVNLLTVTINDAMAG